MSIKGNNSDLNTFTTTTPSTVNSSPNQQLRHFVTPCDMDVFLGPVMGRKACDPNRHVFVESKNLLSHSEEFTKSDLPVHYESRPLNLDSSCPLTTKDPPEKTSPNQTEEWQSQFFRTKLCPYHLSGRCINGQKCRFAHTTEELRPLPDLHSTKLCESYVKKEECQEINCPFAHNPSELRTSSHSFYKVTLCNFYKKGRCWNGVHCRFAHGTSELQTTDSVPPSLGYPKLSELLFSKNPSHPTNSESFNKSHIPLFDYKAPSTFSTTTHNSKELGSNIASNRELPFFPEYTSTLNNSLNTHETPGFFDGSNPLKSKNNYPETMPIRLLKNTQKNETKYKTSKDLTTSKTSDELQKTNISVNTDEYIIQNPITDMFFKSNTQGFSNTTTYKNNQLPTNMTHKDKDLFNIQRLPNDLENFSPLKNHTNIHELKDLQNIHDWPIFDTLSKSHQPFQDSTRISSNNSTITSSQAPTNHSNPLNILSNLDDLSKPNLTHRNPINSFQMSKSSKNLYSYYGTNFQYPTHSFPQDINLLDEHERENISKNFKNIEKRSVPSRLYEYFPESELNGEFNVLNKYNTTLEDKMKLPSSNKPIFSDPKLDLLSNIYPLSSQLNDLESKDLSDSFYEKPLNYKENVLYRTHDYEIKDNMIYEQSAGSCNSPFKNLDSLEGDRIIKDIKLNDTNDIYKDRIKMNTLKKTESIASLPTKDIQTNKTSIDVENKSNLMLNIYLTQDIPLKDLAKTSTNESSTSHNIYNKKNSDNITPDYMSNIKKNSFDHIYSKLNQNLLEHSHLNTYIDQDNHSFKPLTHSYIQNNLDQPLNSDKKSFDLRFDDSAQIEFTEKNVFKSKQIQGTLGLSNFDLSNRQLLNESNERSKNQSNHHSISPLRSKSRNHSRIHSGNQANLQTNNLDFHETNTLNSPKKLNKLEQDNLSLNTIKNLMNKKELNIEPLNSRQRSLNLSGTNEKCLEDKKYYLNNKMSYSDSVLIDTIYKEGSLNKNEYLTERIKKELKEEQEDSIFIQKVLNKYNTLTDSPILRSTYNLSDKDNKDIFELDPIYTYPLDTLNEKKPLDSKKTIFNHSTELNKSKHESQHKSILQQVYKTSKDSGCILSDHLNSKRVEENEINSNSLTTHLYKKVDEVDISEYNTYHPLRLIKSSQAFDMNKNDPLLYPHMLNPCKYPIHTASYMELYEESSTSNKKYDLKSLNLIYYNDPNSPLNQLNNTFKSNDPIQESLKKESHELPLNSSHTKIDQSHQSNNPFNQSYPFHPKGSSNSSLMYRKPLSNDLIESLDIYSSQSEQNTNTLDSQQLMSPRQSNPIIQHLYTPKKSIELSTERPILASTPPAQMIQAFETKHNESPIKTSTERFNFPNNLHKSNEKFLSILPMHLTLTSTHS